MQNLHRRFDWNYIGQIILQKIFGILTKAFYRLDCMKISHEIMIVAKKIEMQLHVWYLDLGPIVHLIVDTYFRFWATRRTLIIAMRS